MRCSYVQRLHAAGLYTVSDGRPSSSRKHTPSAATAPSRRAAHLWFTRCFRLRCPPTALTPDCCCEIQDASASAAAATANINAAVLTYAQHLAVYEYVYDYCAPLRTTCAHARLRRGGFQADSHSVARTAPYVEFGSGARSDQPRILYRLGGACVYVVMSICYVM